MIIMNSNTDVAKKQVHKIPFADLTHAEWAQIAPGKVIVATEDRAWLYRPRSDEDRFTQPMSGAGSISTTRKLLDGAIAAAQRTVNSKIRPPALTATRWVWRLASQYYLTHSAPQIMEEAAKRFQKAKRPILADWAAKKVIEETGHDLLALRDIQALGYDDKAVINTLIPPAAVVLMDYFRRSVQDSDPIDCVGYAFTIERLSLGIDEKYIQAVEALLPLDTLATRCLRVHSSVGADAEHVEEITKMVAELTAQERVRVAIACYETALLCFSPPSQGYISDEELQQILESLKLDKSL